MPVDPGGAPLSADELASLKQAAEVLQNADADSWESERLAGIEQLRGSREPEGFQSVYFDRAALPDEPPIAGAIATILNYHHRLLAQAERTAALREALEAAKISHLRVEGDEWFSCPSAWREDHEGWEGSCQQCDGKPCNHGCYCGADAHNAKIDAALAEPAP